GLVGRSHVLGLETRGGEESAQGLRHPGVRVDDEQAPDGRLVLFAFGQPPGPPCAPATFPVGPEGWLPAPRRSCRGRAGATRRASSRRAPLSDRKSTRLNSSHVKISYAVFCLKKKKGSI